MKIHEIEARLAAIKGELETRGHELSADEIAAPNTEVEQLIAQHKALMDSEEQRTAILQNIANRNEGGQGKRTP